MSAADERASLRFSDSSSVISEEDESAIAAEEAEQEAARGRPIGRTSPVHLHGGQLYSHNHAPQFGGSALSSSPEHHAHFMGGTASGEATPRRRHSPTSHPHAHSGLARYGRSQPASGENTPRRRMSLSDVHDGEDQARADRHNQAVFGFDEKMLHSKFNKLDLQRSRSGQSEEGTVAGMGEELESTYSRESENSLEESDVPIPDSRQVQGAAREIAV